MVAEGIAGCSSGRGTVRTAEARVLARACRVDGARAVVTADHPAAAAIGVATMHAGGNVYDGALAAAFAETVLLPPKCGVAGDLVALAIEPGEDPESLVAVGGAARRLPDAVRERGLPPTGGLAVGVPGAPTGYAALAQRALLPVARLVAPAAALAREGFPWPPYAALLTRKSAELLARENPGGVTYLPAGRPIPAGRRVRLPGLGDALEELAQRGATLFGGALGVELVRQVAARGGVIELEDLTAPTADWSPAPRAEQADTTVWATAAPTHGPVLLEAVQRLGPAPDAGDVMRAAQAASSRKPQLGDGGTAVVVAADHEGRAVAIVHSNSFPSYGSGIVIEPYGLVTSNRVGRGFSGDADAANFPAAGRRPPTTLHAWALGRDGVELLGATPGGENQLYWNTQTIAACLTGARDPGELATTPRWGFRDRTLVVEADFSEPFGEGPRDVVPPLSLRSANQIVRLARDRHPLCAAADPRTDAAAVAW